MENKKMRAEHPKKELAVDILYDIIGSILFGAGIYTFAEGGNFAPGGISGIALIMNKLWNLPVGTMTLILNIPLVIISYKTVGKRFLMKTARTMIISTIFVDLVFPMFPYYTGQRLLAAIYSGALLGLGMVLFYMRGSSSGGADFLTMTIKKKRPHMSLGRLTLLIDLIIILIGWPVFGDVDSVLYGLIAVFVCSMVIDKILYGIGAGSLAIIVTSKRGVTSLEGMGTYTKSKRNVLLCACSKSEAYLVKNAVYQVDDSAFVMFTETSEVLGEGFKESLDEL